MSDFEQLKPCPFCGETPDYPEGSGTQYDLECNCGCASACVQISDLMTIDERVNDPFTNHRMSQEYIDRAKHEVTKMWNTRSAKQSMQGKANFDLSACLNAVADMGFWPQVIYDDNGNWAIWDEGSSNMRLDDDQDYQCSFLIPAEYFKPSLQEAWSCYVEKLKELGNDVSKLSTHAPDSAARIAELEQQLEVARKDAERYRFLRNADIYSYGKPLIAVANSEFSGTYMNGEDADAAIDAAIRQIGGAE